MRFSVTMDEDLVREIDEAAGRTGETRTDWIRQACTDRLTPAAPEEHPAEPAELIELRARTTYQAKTIRDLEADREYHRGEISRLVQETARLSQENSLLTHRLLPPPRAGALSRFKRWVTGEPDT